MFVLTFWVEGVPQPTVMRYLDRAQALGVLEGFRAAPAGTVDMTDDFEARASLPRSRTLVACYTDLAKDIEAQIEIQVVQQRANASLKTRLDSDPVLGLHGKMGLVRPQ